MNSLNTLKNKEILFFINLNNKNGIGHIQRCLRFSLIFPKFKKIIVGEKRIKLKGFSFLNFNKFINNNKKYEFAIIDNYKINFSIEKKIKLNVKNLITIDDLANRKFAADFILNYNPYAKKKLYKNKINEQTKLLLGKNFNFFNNIKLPKKRINKDKLKIFIYLGQNNKIDEIKKIIKKVQFKQIEEIFILSKYKFLLDQKNLKFRHYLHYKNTQNLMMKCDILIISSGIIIYEALALNKLIFAKCISLNQKNNYNYLTKNDYVKKITNLKYLKNYIKIFNSSSGINFYKNYSVIEKLKTIFFGIKNRHGFHISLNDYENNDLIEIYKLQNSESRKFFKSTKLFSFSHHSSYIKNFLKIRENYILMIKKDFNETIGYIKFELIQKKIFISIMMNKNYQNQGIAKHTLNFINSKKFSDIKFFAEIKKDNFKSINIFQKSGFIKNKNLKII